jgi:predicted Zn-dependent protease
MDATLAPAASTEHEVARLRKLQADGRHAEAVQGAQTLLTDLPENRDLLLIAAGSQRFLMQIPQALATLDQLERHHPRFSRMHQERGLCFVALKDAPRAIDALLRAVNINPALPMSWRMLEGLYRMAGDAQNAATAAAHSARLKALPGEIVLATSLFADGEMTAAETLIRPFLLAHGDHPEAMRLLARIGMARDVLDDAETLLEAALELAPDHHAARRDYAQCLIQRH